MTARRPFYKRYPGDFLMATRGLTLEEVGAYSTLIDMMNDRGGPVPDEPRYIAGFLNVSVRKWGVIRQALLDAGKLTIRGEYLSNARFERDNAQVAENHEKLVTWGRKGGQTRAAREREARQAQPSFDLGDDAQNEDYRADKRAENELKVKDKSEIIGQEPQKTAENPKPTLNHARADHIPDRERDKSLSPREKGSKEAPKPKAKPSRVKAANAVQIPLDWKPGEPSEEVADMTARWPDGMLLRELSKFKDHALANGRTAKDWNAAWRNWQRKADSDWKRNGARATGKPSGWNFNA